MLMADAVVKVFDGAQGNLVSLIESCSLIFRLRSVSMLRVVLSRK